MGFRNVRSLKLNLARTILDSEIQFLVCLFFLVGFIITGGYLLLREDGFEGNERILTGVVGTPKLDIKCTCVVRKNISHIQCS